ncbi:SDR family oxidoreductase [Salipiger mucosus]|uniref:3-oxoacyl-[acyl-carrier protein] reductase n=1 Tax=Salipiger mucosus DSM 16094 TaxID=1123237 RepID=S9QWE4_9RHOB|nr:SDR family oxidoreductase [Salipiger mucosus]EPX85696.1 3-oxoacyl-[acyl-carrier protein] reductase [Salipiger mucosus DSM 16094]
MSHSETGPVVVTGGSRGIGAATVETLAAAGRPVVFSYASSDAAAQEVCDRAAAAGGQAVAVKGDAADEAAVEKLFATCIERFGTPTGVFTNAGITGPVSNLADLDVADLRRVLEVNVTGTFLAARAAVRAMGKSGGSIVLMSSRAAKLGSGGEWIHYAASKGAIDTLCTGLAQEVGPQNIRVNAVAPGLIATEIHAAAGREHRLETADKTVPLGRVGTVEEVAKGVLWLLSDDSAYVTGTIIDIGGGR